MTHAPTYDWQDIKTAPKDGRRIKILSAEYEIDDLLNGRTLVPPEEFEAWWSGEVWSCELGFFDPDEVTHWKPLADVKEAGG